MSAQSLPAATPPTQKPPRIIRPRPPSRPRAAQSPGPHHNGSSPREAPLTSNDAPTPMCTPIPWEPPASALKPPVLLPPSASKASLDSQTSPDSPSSTPSPVSRRSVTPEPAPRSPVPPPKPSGSPHTPPLLPRAEVLAQGGSASAPGTVRRLAGRFEWGAEGKVQAGDALEPGDHGAVDVNGEREVPQGNLAGSGSQENGAPDAVLACPPCCPCVCHIGRPGLELRWVPVGGCEDGPRAFCRASPLRTSRSRPSPPSLSLPPVVLTSYRSTAERKLLPPLKAPKPAWVRPDITASGDPPQPDLHLPSEDGIPTGDNPDEARQDTPPASMEGRDKEGLELLKEQNWELPLQDEPLYQNYRAAVLSEELWGVGEDGCPSPTNPGEAPTFARPPGPRNTLWQELPAVRASGLLDTLSPQERRMQESLFEVVTSEASYLRSLRLLTDTFVLSQALRDTLTPRDHHTLFSNVQRVQGVSERFLGTLLSRVRSSPHISDLCDVVHDHAVGPFSVYVDYVRNQQYQEETYSRLMDTNVRFSAELRRLQSLPKCERLPLPSFLLLPFQRITRLRMLLQNILRQTEEGSSRQENAQKALGAVSKIIERCSAEVGRMKQTEELIRLTQRLRFHKVKALPLVSWSRRLELQGELTELGCRRGGVLFTSRPRFTPLCLLLFSDLLLITQPKSGQRLQVLDYAHRSLVQAQQVPDPSGPPTFRLSLLSNHQGRPTHRLLQASSLSDMQRWLGAFPTPGPLPCSPDTVYEDCADCSQELCSESSAPARTEARSLESRALPRHLHKSPEGWLKGFPGAFPAQLVCEVTGEHERRKHLRQHQRLLEAVGPSSSPPSAPPP
ncbi:rho guanine nucleotide exchange factor 15 isoform X1 [Herpailurus yagouaroundi]|uniref:rho guanine nucleotide exchange factor 15 isoform X1 n=1 Tax=Herpailurus yagouaroundi TaxID=1608482 RepID=UPI001AD63B94|nr:rho guanine nucleotide exchange factor 15 isoform X1 [Puma yagouaroundi]XP_040309193.1 rho guanine nucleotide exchange factor 15 isoform X1 [Puma yagouaroundi]XP_040309194.1 rho guanine nucleotide exchange factor 15 isoform X1 [Puma yagouaroundi]XP_040309196.1 rho guanine nucleotide exchange factor 15 isoform X1 [Puma yagouaroundi]XP_040309197.1 rho guanine nucleotide exchange factor 15 isoform X1 [Puma yagouaroundi]XP_040309198.1 rho guanine nucleotide exchange factor 15 isoform X1 [Puma y